MASIISQNELYLSQYRKLGELRPGKKPEVIPNRDGGIEGGSLSTSPGNSASTISWAYQVIWRTGTRFVGNTYADKESFIKWLEDLNKEFESELKNLKDRIQFELVIVSQEKVIDEINSISKILLKASDGIQNAIGTYQGDKIVDRLKIEKEKIEKIAKIFTKENLIPSVPQEKEKEREEELIPVESLNDGAEGEENIPEIPFNEVEKKSLNGIIKSNPITIPERSDGWARSYQGLSFQVNMFSTGDGNFAGVRSKIPYHLD